MNNSSSYTTRNTDVNQSICPAGWTLPKSGNNTSNGSFLYLIGQYGWSSGKITNPNIWNTAIKLPLSGNWYGSLNVVGYGGNFWSPVVYNSGYAYIASAGSDGYVSPGSSDGRVSGNPVRCVAR
jgi:hypothetical protein